jgi:hypothetical protein
MTAFGKIVRGRSGSRCDGCGRISKDQDGYYVDKTGRGGNISSKGRECNHDFCDQCEENNPPAPACPKCEEEMRI